MARIETVCAFAALLIATAALTTSASIAKPPALQGLPPVVGLSFVGRGFDLTTMQPGLAPLTETTYTMGQTWKNPQDGITYSVPDQMFAQTLDESFLSNKTTAFSGTEDIQVWAQHTSHWHSGFLGIDSHSKTTYDYVGRYFTQDQSLAVTDVEVQFLELTAPAFPPPTLTQMFKLALADLPKSYSAANAHMFAEFFQSFGTAYMDSAKLGGRLRGQTWYAKCLLNVTSKDWVSQQSGWSILGLINSHKGHKSHTHAVNGAFKSCNSQDFTYMGGNATHMQPEDYMRWISSTFTAPFPVSYTLQPIASLVQDAAMAKVLQEAADAYLAGAQATLDAAAKKAAASDPHVEQQCCKAVREEMML